jgi:pilus assembly protein CpaE
VRARSRPGGERAPHDCPVFSFVRRSGGMGATSLAIQAAYDLARGRRGQPKKHVCLVDLDFQSGAAWLHLDADPLLDIAEIVRSPHRLDAQLMTAMTVHHPAGFDLIAAPNGSMHPDQVPPGVVGHLMSLACESYECVIVDLPMGWNGWMEEILAASDRVFLTLQLTVVAVKQAHLFLEQIKGTPAGQVPLSVVLNRHRRSWWRPGLKIREVEKALGRRIDACVASDYKLFSGAADHGLPIGRFSSDSRAEREIRKMIQAALKETAPAREPVMRARGS